MAARVACSNTSCTPSPVFAEHSRYLYAPIALAILIPYQPPKRMSEVHHTMRAGWLVAYLFRGDGSLVQLAQLIDRAWVVSQIELAGHQQNIEVGTEVLHLGHPLACIKMS